jgi:hypothetical protein
LAFPDDDVARSDRLILGNGKIFLYFSTSLVIIVKWLGLETRFLPIFTNAAILSQSPRREGKGSGRKKGRKRLCSVLQRVVKSKLQTKHTNKANTPASHDHYHDHGSIYEREKRQSSEEGILAL